MPALLGTRRRSPPRVPLAWQLSLAFFLVSSLALGAVSLFSAALTRSEFRTLLSEQERERIEASLQSHLQAGGTLDTFRPSAARAEPGGPPRSFFVVTDNNFQPRGSHGGPPLTPREREQAVPVRVDGQQVGYLVPRGRPGIEGAGAAFLRRTNQALAQAALVSALLAALLGTWLSRRLLQPLDGLRGGIAALARGEQPRPVQDELGDLLQSFETMHAQVLEAQQMNRQLTADIAHDLNTPLTVMRGQLEAMLDGTFQPTPARLSCLNDQTLHLSRLVADLRLLAQADAGELPLQPQPLPLLPLLEGVAADFAAAAAEHGNTVTVMAPAALTVYADAGRLQQVLENLLGNALTYAPGTPISLCGRADAGGVLVGVLDGGPGVPAEQLPRLFQRLYRADASRTQAAGGLGAGSGLGLSISRGIVQAHGGYITARNRPEGGLAVELWLPAPPTD